MILNISIAKTFLELKKKCALVPFITAGDPHLSVTKEALKILAAEGADIIELGIPYSDPLADGPIIQAASSRALKNNIKFNDILGMVAEVTQEIKTPLIAFTYYNLIINIGIESFIPQIKKAGFKGLLVPDLPLEEIFILEEICKQSEIELILLIGPNTSEDRIRKILQKAQGCVYLISNTGVTGMKLDPSKNIQSRIDFIKENTEIPLIVGFGISTPQDIQLVKSWGVDGIVIGSAFVKKLFESSTDKNLNQFKQYCQSVKNTLI